jgi:hypothetical protein
MTTALSETRIERTNMRLPFNKNITSESERILNPPTASCPICGATVPIMEDGTLAWHNNDGQGFLSAKDAKRCAGAFRSPIRE